MKPNTDRQLIIQNREYWEAIAGERHGEPVEFFRAGGQALEPYELAVIGDPSGLRVLHLACAVGNESLTFSMLGAEVTGVDLSPTHLATGRAKAADLGLTVDFREGDMTDLDPALTGFDLIYISGGGICWVPDIDIWASTVHDRLGLGGRIVICEHHPLWESLSVAGENHLTVSNDYFGGPRFGDPDPRKAPQVTLGRTDPLPEHTVFVWNLGRLVSALIGVGLQIQILQEFAEPDLYPGLGAAGAHIPGFYLVSARKVSMGGPARVGSS